MSVTRSTSVTHSASKSGRTSATTIPLSRADCGPWMSECPQMKSTQQHNATAQRQSADRRAESCEGAANYASAACGSEKCLPT